MNLFVANEVIDMLYGYLCYMLIGAVVSSIGIAILVSTTISKGGNDVRKSKKV